MIIAVKLAEALEAAHAEGVIHRDLKPDNVILAGGRRVVLTDFGIARLLVEGESLTQTGAMIGSPAYMSPEQARGAAIDERSDLFALGTVLYELCTGRLPFAAGDPVATALCIVEGRYRPPQEHDGRVSRELAAVIARLLQTRPAERYPGATALIEDLRRLLAEFGLTTFDDELAAYFAGPQRYDARLAQRVVESSLTTAEQAAARGQVARALSLCDRVLAYRSDHRGALRLVARLSARSARRRVALVVSLIALGIAGTATALWHNRSAPVRVEPAADAGSTQPASIALALDARPEATVVPGPDAALDGGPRRVVSPRGWVGAGRGRRRRRAPVDAAISKAEPGRDAALDAGAARLERRDGANGPARLLITIGPWCDAFVDGQPVGRSPMSRPLRVTPGTHRVVCRQRDGPTFSRTVHVEPGALRRVGGLLRTVVGVRLQLSRGDAVRVDGRTYRRDFSLAPKRHRMELLSKGRLVEGAWVTVPLDGCRLVDRPHLACR
jgi:serine/threonine-protein kinase